MCKEMYEKMAKMEKGIGQSPGESATNSKTPEHTTSPGTDTPSKTVDTSSVADTKVESERTGKFSPSAGKEEYTKAVKEVVKMTVSEMLKSTGSYRKAIADNVSTEALVKPGQANGEIIPITFGNMLAVSKSK
jgi:hypothetical protein